MAKLSRANAARVQRLIICTLQSASALISSVHCYLHIEHCNLQSAICILYTLICNLQSALLHSAHSNLYTALMQTKKFKTQLTAQTAQFRMISTYLLQTCALYQNEKHYMKMMGANIFMRKYLHMKIFELSLNIQIFVHPGHNSNSSHAISFHSTPCELH